MLKIAVIALAFKATLVFAAPVDDARSAYFDYDVNRAEKLYQQVARDAGSLPRDKARAQTELARITWLVDDRPQAALERLVASLPDDPEPCPGALLYARILNASGRQTDVSARLSPYAAECAEVRPNLIVEIARSHVLAAASLSPKARSEAIKHARTALMTMPPLVRATLGAARLAMDVGLLAGNGEEALSGWRDYLWLGNRNRPLGSPFSEIQIASAFRKGSQKKVSVSATLELADVLMRTGFAEELQWLRDDHHIAQGDIRARRLDAYLQMRARLKATVLAHDRAYARDHKEDPDAYDKQLLMILVEGARAAGEAVGGDPWSALNKLWGISGQSGVINGVGGVMLGHAVEERDTPISQNGRNARIRLVMLDNMIENSFSAWLWDSGGGPGGWAGHGLIYQIRPGYAGGTFSAMAVAKPGPARDQALAEAQRLTAEDPSRLRGNEPAALPGLGARLKIQAIDEVAAEANSSSVDLPAFLATFRTAWWNADIDASIIIHEGRHVLDIAEYTGSCALTGDELEYRAKLVEVGLSRHPRLRLSALLGDEMSSESTHGQANRRVAILFRDWILSHSSQVKDYDGTNAAALQVDQLTNEQIQMIAKAADPEKGSAPECAAVPH